MRQRVAIDFASAGQVALLDEQGKSEHASRAAVQVDGGIDERGAPSGERLPGKDLRGPAQGQRPRDRPVEPEPAQAGGLRIAPAGREQLIVDEEMDVLMDGARHPEQGPRSDPHGAPSSGAPFDVVLEEAADRRSGLDPRALDRFARAARSCSGRTRRAERAERART
jgi:hypothetical protein